MGQSSPNTNQQKDMKAAEATHDKKTHADAITGEHGSHPAGVAAGAAAGALAGAAMGTVGGPVGIVAGAAAGGLAGGIAGKQAGEAMSPTVEDAYWKENFMRRSYYVVNTTYDLYQPAYRFGWESHAKHQGRSWNEAEPQLMLEWQKTEPKLEWSKAMPATRDAWERVAKSKQS